MSRHLSSRLTVAVAAVISLTVQASALTDATQFNALSLNQGRPLFFTENRGQWDERVLFKADGAGGLTWFIERDGFTVLFSVPDTTADPIADPRSMGMPEEIRRFDAIDRYPSRAHALKFKFQNALPRTASNFLPEQTTSATASSIESTERVSWNNNYFLGNDESKWAPDCGNFQRVVLKDVWPGVDVVWRGEDSQRIKQIERIEPGSESASSVSSAVNMIEFDFLIHPGADASQIRVECLGLTEDLSFNTGGTESTELSLETSLGTLRMALPEAYQIEEDGSLQEVQAEFRIEGENSFGVALPEGHDSSKSLVVDPLVYSTYVGSNGSDYPLGITSDSQGGSIITGHTDSNEFPSTDGAYDDSFDGGTDVFITRLNENGSELLYSTYVGGDNTDDALSITNDGEGGALVVGYTWSSNFPTLEGSIDETLGGDGDGFFVRLNADGNELLGSTYYGGSGIDNFGDVSVDGQGGVVIVGYTESDNLTTTRGAFDRSFNGASDILVALLDLTGCQLGYCTYLGGRDWDVPATISVNAEGNAVIAGGTYSDNFPTTDGAFDRSYNGDEWDVVVSILNRNGSELLSSTYLGSDELDRPNAIIVEESGAIMLAGFTSSEDFPTTVGSFDRSYNGDEYDAFVVKFNEDLSRLLYSTFLGGGRWDFAEAIILDGSDGVVVSGYTYSNNFPTTEDAIDNSINGDADAFIARLSGNGNDLLYGSYCGGGDRDKAFGIASDESRGVIIAGETRSNNFPVTEGALDRSFNGGEWDAFVTRIEIGLSTSEILFGHVFDLANGNPLNEASIFTNLGDSVHTDQDGYWRINGVRGRHFDLTASRVGYNDSTLTNFDLAFGETLEVNFSLRHPDFSISDDQLGAELPVGESIDIPFNISNQGNGPLIWSADKRLLGDANDELGELRRSYHATDSTGDDRIEGVVFAQDRFYICGSAGDQPSTIYVIDREGSFVNRFPQFGDSRYGYKDIEWDGELIWRSGDDSVFAQSMDGQLVRQWPAPFTPTNNIAWDSDRGLLYLAGTTSNIATFDLDGNAVGDQLNRLGFRIYGLSYWRDDPDGYPLYILNVPAGNQPLIHKMNTETGDTMFVAALQVPEGQSLTGLYITNQFDVYSWVMMTILNAPPADGGDCIMVYQLDARKDWFDLDVFEGELPAGETQDLILTLDATALPDTLFDAEIVFRHNASEDGFHLMVSLDVISIPPPPPFSLISPENGDTLIALPLQGDSLRMPPIEFIWEAVGAFDTVSYRFEIGLNDALVNFEVSDTSLALNLDTLGLPIGFGSRIEWNVVAQPRGEDEFPCIQPFHFFIMPNATDRREEPRPVEFGLSAPYPNPFNSSVRLTYGLPEVGKVRMSIFDVSGREVIRLVDGNQAAGVHTIDWTADANPTGVYLARLEYAGQVRLTKLTLLK